VLPWTPLDHGLNRCATHLCAIGDIGCVGVSRGSLGPWFVRLSNKQMLHVEQ
jgi:hypothetical protein